MSRRKEQYQSAQLKLTLRGVWDIDYDPLNSLKAALREFDKRQVLMVGAPL